MRGSGSMLQSNLEDRAAFLNARFAQEQAQVLLQAALIEGQFGKTGLVSSFGAEAAVLLHMVSQINPQTAVLFVDTQMLFPETMDYQRALSERLGLTDVRIVRPDQDQLRRVDPGNTLHQNDPDACCAARKSAPLFAALGGFDAWISGRKRYQGGQRQTLPLFEPETGTGRVKLNPLANWTRNDISTYFEEHDLPAHPLVARGYGSIGCAPCTVPAQGREGRWKGQPKTECGIHFENGRMVRAGGVS